MRRSLGIMTLLLAAGCSQQPARETTPEPRSADVQESAAPSSEMSPPPPVSTTDQRGMAPAGPNVSPTAAPGVAFNYRYAFRLAPQRVGQVQEQHARACEQLGISRCRITGMRYRVVNDRDVEAMLAFKLDPSLARRFGQAGADLVTRSEGMLIESEITGTDVGTTIRAAGRNIEELTEELNRLEARLRQRGLSADEKSRLEYEAEQLRQQIRANRANREEQQESLATTPVVFQYGSGDLVPGFDTRPSLRRAAERAWDNFVEGVAMMFIIFVTLLPWALLALLVWGVVRTVRRRWRRRTPPAAPETAPAT